MATLRVTVVEDESEPPGNAILRVSGVSAPPPSARFTIRPYDDQTSPRDWPTGPQTPRKAELSGDVWSLYVGPRIVDRIPGGAPVMLEFLGLNTEAECLWPVLAPSQEDWGPAGPDEPDYGDVKTVVVGPPKATAGELEKPRTATFAAAATKTTRDAPSLEKPTTEDRAAGAGAVRELEGKIATLNEAVASAQQQAERNRQERVALDLKLVQSEESRRDLEAALAKRQSSATDSAETPKPASRSPLMVVGAAVVALLIGFGAGYASHVPPVPVAPPANSALALDPVELAPLLGADGSIELAAKLAKMSDQPRNLRLAEALWKFAAEQGSDFAMYDLALLYNKPGWEGSSHDEALSWARRAASGTDQKIVDAAKKLIANLQ